ncbi:MAG: hypothetical protein V4726_16610 [Verrucomicrobiota bacterium]
MIALAAQLPLLRVGRYEVTTYGQDWLEENIRRAARAAGEGEWLFTEDIVSSLLVYLRERFAGSAITLEELSGKIRAILEKIGFGDIGQCVKLTPPALSLSLDDLAREAGEGFELRFFQLLDARVSELAALHAPSVALTASREGVKRLCAAKTWNQSCRALEKEIALFLRIRLPSNGFCHFEMAA